MYTVNGSPYFRLDSLLSESDAKTLDEEISWGLTLAEEVSPSEGSEFSRGDADLSLYDHRFKDCEFAKNELTPDEREKFRTLSFLKRSRYLKFGKKAYFPWGTSYSLIDKSSWVAKMETHDKVFTEEAKRLFPKLIDWAQSLPVFKGIGRISILGVDACQHATCHRDTDPSFWKSKDQLLMLSPRGDKLFYIFDEVKKEKIFTNSKLFTFDDLAYHGVDPSPYFTYSVRIDGPFTEEYDRKISYDRVKQS